MRTPRSRTSGAFTTRAASPAYASREIIATPRTDVPIETGQAFAWNPSITGAKAEETFVLTDVGAEIVAAVGVRV